MLNFAFGSAACTDMQGLHARHAAALVVLLSGAACTQEQQCYTASEDLPFAGLCPHSELECPPCPATRPVKCPTGGCEVNPRDCLPNVNIRGKCDAEECSGIEFCHIHVGLAYACWEWGHWTEHNATFSFEQLNPLACGHCLNTRSRYRCAACCGQQARARWRSTYSDAPAAERLGIGTREGALEGAAFLMQGTKWVCMIKAVAERLELANSAAGLAGPDRVEEAAADPPPPPPSVLNDLEAALAFPMPAEYSLS